jgi:hypothetical protein
VFSKRLDALQCVAVVFENAPKQQQGSLLCPTLALVHSLFLLFLYLLMSSSSVSDEILIKHLLGVPKETKPPTATDEKTPSVSTISLAQELRELRKKAIENKLPKICEALLNHSKSAMRVYAADPTEKTFITMNLTIMSGVACLLPSDPRFEENRAYVKAFFEKEENGLFVEFNMSHGIEYIRVHWEKPSQ